MGIFDLFKKREKHNEKIEQEVEVREVQQEETKKEMKNIPHEISIYERIISAMDENGVLPRDFSLPDDTPDNQMRFAPGAMDGIRVYHMQRSDGSEQAKYVLDLLVQASAQGSEAVITQLTDYLHTNSVLSFINEMSPLVYREKSYFTPQMALDIGYSFMVHGTDVEVVKLGIALIGLLDVEHNAVCRDVILNLGRYDEFTLFTLVAIGRWQEKNEITFDIAKQLYGWGKIHAVERLEPLTEEIEDWILCYGCHNGVVDAYLGLTCAVKGDMLGVLKQNTITPEQLRGINEILNACLNEGPVPGISAYEHTKDVIEHYLSHVNKQSFSLETADTLLCLANWLESSDIKIKPILINRCVSLVEKEQTEKLILQALEGGQKDQIWLACDLADKLNFDIKDILFERMQNDPVQYVGMIKALCDDPWYAEQVFKLYESYLPLEKIAVGMGDLVGLGKAFKYHSCLDFILTELKAYPNYGYSLINTGLRSPVIRNRSLTCEVIKSWIEKIGTENITNWNELIKLIELTLEEEVNDGVREKLQSILA